MDPKPVVLALTYGPAYVGLGLAMFLALACNAFLDIGYGSFAFESLCWASLATVSLAVGWRHRGQPEAESRGRQTQMLFAGAGLFLLVFLPIWGLPRAGAYLLACLQAAIHLSLTRRNFYFSALCSLVLVLFAVSHFRADWTLLFYVIPFVFTLVFTVVAEQVSRRAEWVRAASLDGGPLRGQWLAVVAAAGLVLVLGGLLYGVTPQQSPLNLFWKYGLPGQGELLGGDTGQAGQKPGDSDAGAGGGGSGLGQAEGGGAGVSSWPTPDQMRDAAGRRGMPAWQKGTILRLADVSQSLNEMLEAAAQRLDDLKAQAQRFMAEFRNQLLGLLLALIALVLLAALWFLLREVRPVLWLGTRLDYLRYSVLDQLPPGRLGIRHLYAASGRLFAYHGEARPAWANSREYYLQLRRRYPAMAAELAALTLVFEVARYGEADPGPAAVQAAQGAYRRLFRQLA